MNVKVGKGPKFNLTPGMDALLNRNAFEDMFATMCKKANEMRDKELLNVLSGDNPADCKLRFLNSELTMEKLEQSLEKLKTHAILVHDEKTKEEVIKLEEFDKIRFKVIITPMVKKDEILLVDLKKLEDKMIFKPKVGESVCD